MINDLIYLLLARCLEGCGSESAWAYVESNTNLSLPTPAHWRSQELSRGCWGGLRLLWERGRQWGRQTQTNHTTDELGLELWAMHTDGCG